MKVLIRLCCLPCTIILVVILHRQNDKRRQRSTMVGLSLDLNSLKT